MILKFKHRKTSSFRQLLNYMMSDKERASEQMPFITTQHVRGDDVNEWAKSFEENERLHGPVRKKGKKLLHEILSFHVKDKHWIDNQTLEDITREYLRLRSPRGLFVAVPHIDDDHQHVHVCGSPWEFGGQKSLRLSHKELVALKKQIQAYQQEKYPELVHSVVEHGT